MMDTEAPVSINIGCSGPPSTAAEITGRFHPSRLNPTTGKTEATISYADEVVICSVIDKTLSLSISFLMLTSSCSNCSFDIFD